MQKHDHDLEMTQPGLRLLVTIPGVDLSKRLQLDIDPQSPDYMVESRAWIKNNLAGVLDQNTAWVWMTKQGWYERIILLVRPSFDFPNSVYVAVVFLQQKALAAQAFGSQMRLALNSKKPTVPSGAVIRIIAEGKLSSHFANPHDPRIVTHLKMTLMTPTRFSDLAANVDEDHVGKENERDVEFALWKQSYVESLIVALPFWLAWASKWGQGNVSVDTPFDRAGDGVEVTLGFTSMAASTAWAKAHGGFGRRADGQMIS